MNRTHRYLFELVGGRICLDFVNTMSGMRVTNPTERLAGYADLLSWAEQAGLLPVGEARRLQREAEQHPRRAAEALAEAVRLREALHAALAAALRGRRPEQQDLEALSGWISSALAQRKLQPARSGFALRWEERPDDLLAFLRPVAASAAELLASPDLRQVRLCAESEVDRCGWLFLDETKNRSRRFCTTGDCGNRAKQRRHWQRLKAATQ